MGSIRRCCDPATDPVWPYILVLLWENSGCTEISGFNPYTPSNLKGVSSLLSLLQRHRFLQQHQNKWRLKKHWYFQLTITFKLGNFVSVNTRSGHTHRILTAVIRAPPLYANIEFVAHCHIGSQWNTWILNVLSVSSPYITELLRWNLTKIKKKDKASSLRLC